MEARDLPNAAATSVVETVLRAEGEPDETRFVVCDALVVRRGSHYRIEAGGEAWDELQTQCAGADGRCGCGSPLSSRPDAWVCRTCGAWRPRYSAP